MQAADKKRPKEEKDILHRLRPFARLQTAEDFEIFSSDILCRFLESFWTPTKILTLPCLRPDESILRKRIQDLQHYRRMGLTTLADIEKYDADQIKRVSGRSQSPCSISNQKTTSRYKRRLIILLAITTRRRDFSCELGDVTHRVPMPEPVWLQLGPIRTAERATNVK